MVKDVATYLKNVGKSIGYSAVDVVSQDMEFTGSFAQTNSDLFKEAYAAVKDFKGTYKKVEGAITSSKLYEAADAGFKATLEDLKTGKFYNKSRIDEFARKYGGDLGNFDDMDIDFKTGDSDESELSGDKMISSTIESSMRDSTAAITSMVAQTGKYVVETNRASTKVLYNQNLKMMSGLKSTIDLLGINTSNMLKAIGKVSETHANNSKTFFDISTKLQQENNAILKEMLEMQRELYKDKQNKDKGNNKRTSISDIAIGGVPDIKAYFANVKKNASNMLSGTGLDMLAGDTFGEGTNMLAQFVASPLSFLPNAIIRSMIPNTLKNTAKAFDKSLSGVFTTMIARFNKWAKDDDPLFGKLGQLLGIRIDEKNSIDPSKYKKGPVPFDGVVRKSIVEVIPGHLARIESLLSGRPENFYDYTKGKWTTRQSLQNDWDSRERSNVQGAFSGLLEEMSPYLDKIRRSDRATQERMSEEIYSILSHMYDNYGINRFNTSFNASSDIPGVSSETYRIFANAIKRVSRGTRMGVTRQVMEAKESRARDMRSMEETLNPYFNLVDGSQAISHVKTNPKSGITKHIDPIGIFSKDDNGRDIFYYLRQMLSNVLYIRTNGVGSESGGQLIRGGVGKKGKRTSNSTTMPSYREVDFDSASGLQYKYNKNQIALDDRYDTEVSNLVKLGKVTQLSDSVYFDDDKNLDMYAVDNTFNHYDNEQEAKLDKGDKNFIRNTILLSEKQRKEMASNRAKLKGSSKDGKVSIFQELLSAGTIIDKFNIIRGSLEDIASMPTKALEHIIANADKKLYDFVYGVDTNEVDEDGKPIYGFMNMLIHQVKGSFTELNNWINTGVIEPLKEKLGIDKPSDLLRKGLGMVGLDYDDIKKSVQDFFAPLKDNIKDVFGGAFDYVENSVKSVYSPIYKRVTGKEPLTAYERRQSKYNKTLNALRNNDTKSFDREKAIDRFANQIANEYESKGFDTNKKELRDQIIAEATAKADDYINGTDYYEDKDKDIKSTLFRMIKHRDLSKYAKTSGLDFKDIKTSDVANAVDSAAESIPGNYRGTRYVSRGGIAAISPGELIIPAELNPFNPNRKNVNKKKEAANEKKSKKDFIKELSDSIYEKSEGGTIPDNKKSGGFVNELKGVGSDLMRDLGLIKPGDEKKLATAVQNGLAKFTEVGPYATATGLLGGSVGLLTGIVGGPLVGAAIGASVGIIRKSDTLQNWLFGEKITDKNGNETRKGGFINREIYEGVTKYLPSMSKFGIAGAVTGLLTPFGAIGGLLIGSAVGFANRNERISEMLYGDKDGLLNKDRREAISKAFPNIAIGTISTMVLGPFGLLGNAALGAGLGLLSTSDGFKDVVFGEKDEDGKREGGLVGSIKTNIINPLGEFGKSLASDLKDFIADDLIAPLKEAITPITTEIGHVTKSVLSVIPNTVNWIFEKSLGVPLDEFVKDKILDPLGKLFKGSINFLLKPIKAVVSAPFKLIGGIGNMYKQNQIMQGRADYMSAAERNQWRSDHPIRGALSKLKFIPGVTGLLPGLFSSDRYAQDDIALENMSLEQSQRALDLFRSIDNNGDKRLRNDLNSKRKEIASAVNKKFRDKLIGGSRARILSAINKGDFAKATRLMGTLKGRDGNRLSEADRQELFDIIQPLATEKQQIENNRKLITQLQPGARDELKKLGITNFSNKNIGKYISMLKTEVATKSVTGINESGDIASKIITDNAEEQTNRIISTLEDIASIISAIHSGQQFSITSSLGNNMDAMRSSQYRDLEKQNAKASKASDKLNRMFTKRRDSRISSLGKYYDSKSLKSSLGDAIGNNESIYNMLATAGSHGHAFKSFNGLEDLTDNGIQRITDLSKYMAIPSADAEKIAKLREKEFANVIKFAKQGYDFYDENGNISEAKLKAIGSIKENRNSYIDKSRRKKGIFGAIQEAGSTVLSGFSKPFVKTDAEYVMDFEKAGLSDYVTTNEIVSMTDRQRQAILKNPNKFIKMKTGSDTASSRPALSGIFGGIQSKISGLFGRKKRSTDGSVVDSDKESVDQEIAQNAETKKRHSFFDAVETLSTTVKKMFKHQQEKDEEEEKVPWWKKFLDGAGKVFLGVTALGAIPLIYNFLKDKVYPYVKHDIFEMKIQPFWYEKVLPFLEDHFSPVINGIRTVKDWLTSSGDFAPNKKGGLTERVGAGVGNIRNWLLSEGKFKGNGLQELFTNNIVKFYGGAMELAVGKIAPIIVTGVVKVLPGILLETAKAINSFFSGTMAKLTGRTFSPTKDDGVSNLNKISKAADAENANLSNTFIFDKEVKSMGKSSALTRVMGSYYSTVNQPSSDTTTKPKNSKNPISDFMTGYHNAVSDGDAILNSYSSAIGAKNSASPIGLDGRETVLENLAGSGLRAFATKGTGGYLIKSAASSKGLFNRIAKVSSNAVSKIPLVGNLASRGIDLLMGIPKGLNKIGEAGASKLGSKAIDTAANIANKGLISKVKDFMAKGLNKLFSSSTFYKAVKEGMERVGKEATEEIVEKTVQKASKNIVSALIEKVVAALGKASGKAIAKITADISTGGIAIAVFAIADFISGMNNANTILGVIDDITIPERIICGLLKAVNGFFTWGLVPEDILVDIFTDFLAPIFHIDVSALKERQARAVDSIQAYNEQYGTSFDSVEAFNAKDKWTTKLKNKFSDMWNGTTTDEYGKVNPATGTNAGIKDDFEAVKDSVLGTVSGMFKDAFSGDFGWILKQDEVKSDNPYTKAAGAGANLASKYLLFLPALTTTAISAVVQKIGPVIKGVGTVFSNMAITASSMFKSAIDGDFGALFNRGINNNAATGGLNKSDNVLVNLLSIATSGMLQSMLTVPALMATTVGFVVKNLDPIINGIKDLGGSIGGVTSNTFKSFMSGNYLEGITTVPEKTGNPVVDVLAGLFTGITKLPLSIVGIPISIIGNIKNKFDAVSKFLSDTGEYYAGEDSSISKVYDGTSSIFSSDYWKNDSKKFNGEDGGLSALPNVYNFIYKLINAVPAQIGGVFSKIGDGFNALTKNIDKYWNIDADNAIIDQAKSGKISVFSKEYWKDTSTVKDDNNVFSVIGSLGSKIFRLGSAFGTLFTGAFNKIKDSFSGIWDGMKDSYNSFFKDTDSASQSGFGSGAGHIYQRDPKLNMRFNTAGDSITQTMADSGCGPVAAATVLGQYNKNIDPKAAAKYALAGGFKERNGGTEPSYFGSLFSNYGISSKFENNPNNIKRSLASGNPVIFMGQTSGMGSTPFTSTPHYVVGTGLDSSGNVIIQDPDSRVGDTKYKLNNIINSSKVNIVTGMGGMRSGSSFTPRYGMASAFKDAAYYDIGYYTVINASELKSLMDAFSGRSTALSKHASAFVTAASQTGIDPRFLVALAASEGGWDLNSALVRQTNNLFSVGAYDGPGMISNSPTYKSIDDAIIDTAGWLKRNYYNKGQKCIYDFAFKYKDHSYNTSESWVNLVSGVYSGLKKSDAKRKIIDISYIPNTTAAPSNSIQDSLDSLPWISSSNTSSSESESTSKPTFWDSLAEYGKNITRGLFGNKIVDFLYGSSDDKSSAKKGEIFGSDATSNQYGFQPQGTDASYGEYADQFFAKTSGYSNYGSKYGVYNSSLYGNDKHTGIDYQMPEGTRVYSPVSGIVQATGYQPKSWGFYVMIKDKAGYYHLFAHLSKVLVDQGSIIAKNQIIGLSGSTGNSTGPHLHYEVRTAPEYKNDIDPNSYDYNSLSVTAGKTSTYTMGSGYGSRSVSSPIGSYNSMINKNTRVIDTTTTSNSNGTTKAAGGAGPDVLNYTKLILTIIQMLDLIATNTDQLSKIYNLLDKRLNISGSGSGTEKGSSNSTSTVSTNDKINKLKKALLADVNRLKSGGRSQYKDIVDTDETKNLIEVMTQLARE